MQSKAQGLNAAQAGAALKELGFAQENATHYLKTAAMQSAISAKRLKATGRALSEIDAIKVQEAQKALGVLATESRQSNATCGELAPVIQAVSDLFAEWTQRA